MSFALSEEQQLLQESLVRYIEREYSFEQRQLDLRDRPQGFNRQKWQDFAELGWLGMTFCEDQGGFGGSPMDVALLMEQVGRGLMREPFLATLTLAGGVLARCSDAIAARGKVEAIVAGELLASLAFLDAANSITTAESNEDRYVINGKKIQVLHAASADDLLVTARLTDGNVGMFCIERETVGVDLRKYQTMDGLASADIRFNAVEVGGDQRLDSGNAESLLCEVIDDATFAVSAEAVGCMEILNQQTIEYCKSRNQFGQPLSSFQALQHRMVDMYIAYEKTKSLLYMTAHKLSDERCEDKAKWLSALKAQAAQSGRYVAQNALQLHGGMGMTDELCVSHYFKRLTVIEQSFGNVDSHLEGLL